MSNDSKNIYDDFFNKSDSDNSIPAPSEELLVADRGQPQLKIDKSFSLKDNKNMVIAGVLVALTLVVIVIFVVNLASKLGNKEEKIEVPVDAALSKLEFQDIARLQSKIDSENAKKAAAAKAARDRLAALAAEKAEKERLEAERLAAEKANQNTSNTGESRLGRFSDSGSSEKLTMSDARQKKPEELTPEERAMLRKGAGSILGYDSPVKPAVSSSDGGTERPSTLGNMLITERHKNGIAYLRASREFLLIRGTNIACTLLPRVVTNYPSQPSCIVNEDIYSPDGVVLVERGSKVLGEQRTAMKAGVSKVFIAWADIETPAGVSINIDSMGADQLGGSGLDAWIDNHYMQRFGGAIMLSFIDDFFEIIANKASKTEYNFEASSENASSMAQIVLENTINIEPTGYIMPAQQINIIVARDVDFTHIYKVY